MVIVFANEKRTFTLFIGRGDFIGMQFVLNHKPDDAITIAQVKPTYTDMWNFYDVETLFEI